MDFLGQESFWIAIATLTGVISLLLQIAPRIWGQVRGARAVFSIQESVGLFHSLGQLRLVTYVYIRNPGARTTLIKRIGCVLEAVEPSRPSAIRRWRLPVYSFAPVGAPANAKVLPGPIDLTSGDRWNALIECRESLSVAEEESLDKLFVELNEDYESKVRELRNSFTQSIENVTIDQNLVDKALQIYNQKFQLEKGEYRILIGLIDEADKVIEAKTYKFVIYESQIERMKDVKDSYLKGHGLVTAYPASSRFLVEQRIALEYSGKLAIDAFQTAIRD